MARRRMGHPRMPGCGTDSGCSDGVSGGGGAPVAEVAMRRRQQTRLFYEKVPVIAYGDLFGLRAARKTVKGFDEKTDRPRFYNVWLGK